MVGAVLGEAVLECGADARFVVGTAELDGVFEFLVVGLDVGVGWHGGDCIRWGFPPWRASLAGAARDGGGCDFGVTLVWSEPCILGSVGWREGDAWSQSWLRPSDFCDDQLPSLQGPPVTLSAIRGGNLCVLGCGLPLCPSDISPMNGGNPAPSTPVALTLALSRC